MLSAEFFNLDPNFGLIQNSDDLFLSKSFLHLLVSFFLIKILHEPLNQTGPNFGGKVNSTIQ